MTSKLTYVGAIGMTAVALIAASPAYAAGTTAGTTITNNVTVDYQVGGVAQGQQTASNSFVVDRKINLLVEEVGSVTTEVVPGQSNAVTTFQLTNTSNEVLDFALTASQIAGGTAAHGGTDSFDVSNVRIYRDNTSSGTVGSFDAADTLVTYIDELATDTPIRLFVVADVPAGLSTGAVAGVQLRATAREGGASGTQGAAITQTAGANTAAKDTVFADVAGVNDANRDASHSAADDYTVKTQRRGRCQRHVGRNQRQRPDAVDLCRRFGAGQRHGYGRHLQHRRRRGRDQLCRAGRVGHRCDGGRGRHAHPVVPRDRQLTGPAKGAAARTARPRPLQDRQ